MRSSSNFALAIAVLLAVHRGLFAMALSTTNGKSSVRHITLLPMSISPSHYVLQSSVADQTKEGSQLKGASNLSPFLQEMVDEQRELQMNVGRAMDVLRKDYPFFLKRAPDYSIYHDAVRLRDSSGAVQLSMLSSYKRSVSVVRTMLSLIYDTDRSVIQNRMVYDSTRTQIRVSFNAMLVTKLGGRAVHVDGISVYTINPLISDGRGGRREGGGQIIEHRIEKLLVNGAAMQPPYFSVFGLDNQGVSAGALAGAGAWS